MKKVILATIVVASLGLATVLDGVGGIGLGDNPAALPELVKPGQGRIDAGFTLLQSRKYVTDITVDDSGVPTKESKKGPKGPSAPWASYTGTIAGFYVQAEYDHGGGSNGKETTKSFTDGTRKTLTGSSVSETFDEGNTVAFKVAKEIAGLTAGIGVDVNSQKDVTRTFKKDAVGKKISGTNSELITEATIMTTTLGLEKKINAKQTLVVGQTLPKSYVAKKSTRRGPEGSYNVETPPETALGYVIKVSDALEIAGTLGYNWGGSYKRWFDNSKGGSTLITNNIVVATPYKTYGAAASYTVNKSLEFQGFASFKERSLHYAKHIQRETPHWIDQETRTLGLNVNYTLGKIGTVVLSVANVASEPSRSSLEGIGPVTSYSNTTTSLGYTYLF